MSLPGEVYWRDGHAWIIISKHNHPSGRLLYVNLTTLDDECPDDECILIHTDYTWIEHPTAVAFSRAKITDTRKFEEAVRLGYLTSGNPSSIPDACLKKIQSAARASRHLSKDKKSLLPDI